MHERPIYLGTVCCTVCSLLYSLPLQSGDYIKVLMIVLMRVLDKLFGDDASDATVQTGCNILKVHTHVCGCV